jgi:hypothetical protein
MLADDEDIIKVMKFTNLSREDINHIKESLGV